MRPQLLLTINCKFAVDFFARGLHTRTAVARLSLHQLGFLVLSSCVHWIMRWFGFIMQRFYRLKLMQEFIDNVQIYIRKKI